MVVRTLRLKFQSHCIESDQNFRGVESFFRAELFCGAAPRLTKDKTFLWHCVKTDAKERGSAKSSLPFPTLNASAVLKLHQEVGVCHFSSYKKEFKEL